MIITKQEFKELGFECETRFDSKLEGCIKRAEYVLNALCCGTLRSALAQSESNAVMIKQAVAFEADALLKSEISADSSAQSGVTERVSIGDLSYTESSQSASQSAEKDPVDVPGTVKRLLCAAGCYFGRGIAEVIE